MCLYLPQVPNDYRYWCEQGMDPAHANFLHHNSERATRVPGQPPCACMRWSGWLAPPSPPESRWHAPMHHVAHASEHAALQRECHRHAAMHGTQPVPPPLPRPALPAALGFDMKHALPMEAELASPPHLTRGFVWRHGPYEAKPKAEGIVKAWRSWSPPCLIRQAPAWRLGWGPEHGPMLLDALGLHACMHAASGRQLSML